FLKKLLLEHRLFVERDFDTTFVTVLFLFAVDYLLKIRFTFIYRMNHVHRRMNIKGGDDKMQNVSYLKESGIFR
ncbi:TPA: hypothetical protein ACWWHU_002235, partial [Enterococcus faecium]